MTKEQTNIKTSEWTKVGEIGVDAGTCWVGDPCYILFKDEDAPHAIGKDWHEFCDTLDSDSTQYNYDAGHPGLGVCVSTGFGDGLYDVEVKYVRVKGWGKRVKEVRVVFIPDESLSEDEVLDPDDNSEELVLEKQILDVKKAMEKIEKLTIEAKALLKSNE